jgi:hypothetical protein
LHTRLMRGVFRIQTQWHWHKTKKRDFRSIYVTAFHVCLSQGRKSLFEAIRMDRNSWEWLEIRHATAPV